MRAHRTHPVGISTGRQALRGTEKKEDEADRFERVFKEDENAYKRTLCDDVYVCINIIKIHALRDVYTNTRLCVQSRSALTDVSQNHVIQKTITLPGYILTS